MYIILADSIRDSISNRYAPFGSVFDSSAKADSQVPSFTQEFVNITLD